MEYPILFNGFYIASKMPAMLPNALQHKNVVFKRQINTDLMKEEHSSLQINAYRYILIHSALLSPLGLFRLFTSPRSCYFFYYFAHCHGFEMFVAFGGFSSLFLCIAIA